ncbi:MAG: cobaltochelatase subunit CobN, partial [Dolichospermum sp.]
MHRINATAGGWNQSEGLFFLEQTIAPFVLITAADTDIQTLGTVVSKLPDEFPEIRVANLLQLQQQISIDTYSEQVLESAQVIVLRLIGGSSYWNYGLEVIQEIGERNGTTLIIMPGDDGLDLDLISKSTIAPEIVQKIWQYFQEGGTENFLNALKFIADTALLTEFNPPPPQPVPRVGLYGRLGTENNTQLPITNYPFPKVGILFYRAHYLSGNTKVIDALCNALLEKNLQPVPVFVSSLREPGVSDKLSEWFTDQNGVNISLLMNTTSFSLAQLETEIPQIELWEKLDVPVLQVILCASSIEQWESESQGLTPRDIAINVALPEVDGRIISRAVSFKTLQARNHKLETDIVVYEPLSDRIEFVTQLAANWVRLRVKMPSERQLALILANYPNTNGRLANGVGLDTPASCVEILKALKLAGYELENIPETGDELIQILTSSVTNDPEGKDWKPINQSLSATEYKNYFSTLPINIQKQIIERWGLDFDFAESKVGEENFSQLPITNHQSPFPISGIKFGNIFVGIQPSRGYDLDPSLNYHAPDLEPTHNYLAFYHWLREYFAADAIIHLGKHGNLEWLPGKSVALSNTCYPEIALGPMPHLYPFIVNDPGEGSQAKRRAQAVIIDHLTPPMTRAQLYGPLQQLENLIDEYYEAENLDPSRLTKIRDRIQELVIKENLYKDLGITNPKDITNFETLILNSLDGYLCELKEAQIRDGLHIFGQCPQGTQLRDLIVAIARIPNRYSIGITRTIAKQWDIDIDPLTDDLSTPLSAPLRLCERLKSCHIIGDVVELLEIEAAHLVEKIIAGKTTENWISDKLLPSLQKTSEEITNLLRGLDGKYVKSGASGAPTRGRPEVLPTGKNFYAVDIRAIPTETAWDIGRKAAETLIETYTQANGEYPKTLALSVWGTATMRTGGDDLAEALA